MAIGLGVETQQPNCRKHSRAGNVACRRLLLVEVHGAVEVDEDALWLRVRGFDNNYVAGRYVSMQNMCFL